MKTYTGYSNIGGNMDLIWRKFDNNSKSTILESISSKPLYKLKMKDGHEVMAFVKDHELVMNTADLKKVDVELVEEYGVIGPKMD
jgi:hypothetical protein